jgi:tetratricopeptide (TPR) repeat protein
MNSQFVSLVLCSSLILPLASQTPPNTAAPSSVASSPAATTVLQLKISDAQKRIKADAKSWQPYADLATAYLRSARDTEDVGQYDEAEAAVKHVMQLSPGNYEGQKLEASVLLGKHEFANALKLATELNHKVPDDVTGWSLLVDIHVAVGSYAEAERAAQWILDLRPGSALGFEKAAGLRDLFGDAEGAIEFYQETNRRTSPNDPVQRAWLFSQIARVNLAADNLKAAQAALEQALALFPQSQIAAGISADIEMAQGKYAEAAAARERSYQKVKSPANLYAWAEALEKAGLKEQAASAFKKFEGQALAETHAPYNANQALIYFYSDYKNNPSEALRVAQREEAIRQDEGTLAAAAWAFFQNGNYIEAEKRMNRALAVGVRNPQYFCHAAQIAAKANDAAGAEKYKKELASFSQANCAALVPVQTAKEVMR